jgi:hypothetical protein
MKDVIKVIIAVLAVAATLLLSGCRTTEKIVEVEKVRIDTTYITQVQRDSIVRHDSIYLHEYMRGDTVYVEKTRWLRVIEDRLRVDTLYRLSIDTLQREVYVERKPTLLEKSGYRLQGAAFLILMGAFAWLVIRLTKHP